MSKEQAAAAKARGNEAFTKGDYAAAVEAFSEAIQHDPTDAVFYSNRSGAYASLKQFDKALDDANKCVELKPSFVKGYSRQGVALFGLSRFDEAKAAYEAGLKQDPSNAALQDGLKDVESKMRSGAQNPLGSLFGPDMWRKLGENPKTREYMKDPSFMQKMQMLSSNPNAFGMMAQDPQLQEALGVILGLGTEGFSAMRGDKAGAAAAGGAAASSSRTTSGGAEVEDEPMSDDEVSGSSGVQVEEEKPKSRFKYAGEMTPEEAKAARDASYAAVGQTPPEPQRVLTEEEQKELAERQAEEKRKAEEAAAKAKLRAEADKEKNAGNDLYKKRDFAGAIAKYSKAIEIDPTNIVYYTNLAAVYMEQKEYQQAIDTALKGVDIGKQNMAGYVDLAKALTRIGSAYQAMGKLDEAIDYYSKSLVEDYNDKTKTLLKKVESDKKKADEAAYIDPAKSEEHKAKGNDLVAQNKFVEAIAEYTEAIKRNPQNYKVYSNRALCYTKLMDWGRGLDDCNKCIAMDPTFIKAYIRKGKIEHFLKQYHKALATYDKALELEPTNVEVAEAKRATLIAVQTSEGDPERAKQAMQDPEIVAIMRDPTISKVLQDMQESPQAAQAAMRDKDIRAKIEKLIAAGVLGVR